MCDCKSYNRGGGTRADVVLNLPDNIAPYKKNRTVCVDACIVDVIKHLWVKGIQTLGCCCGHNKGNPGIVIENGYNAMEIKDWIYPLIKQVDKRQWEIFQWQLVKV